MTPAMSKRTIPAFLISFTLAGCTITEHSARTGPLPSAVPTGIRATYTNDTNEKFPVPSLDPSALAPENLRQQVDYATREPPGTLIVDTNNRFIYLVQEGGKAMRYGVGVGREGLEFKGSANVGGKREWPRWTPTPNMIAREPEKYRRWAKGMEGGPDNPLGARALYLFKDGKDTLFRIHGTNEPETIGHAVSSGCIRMMNQDVIDLYRRVPKGSKVVVI